MAALVVVGAQGMETQASSRVTARGFLDDGSLGLVHWHKSNQQQRAPTLEEAHMP